MGYILFSVFAAWIIIAVWEIATIIDDNDEKLTVELIVKILLFPIRLLFRFMDKIKEILQQVK